MAQREKRGRRCDNGCESWPDDDQYNICPVCQEETSKYSNLIPLDPEEAVEIAVRASFERYYEKHCRKRGYGADGTIPIPQALSDEWDAKYPEGRPND